MANNDIVKAGTLVLSNLKELNDANLFWSDILEPSLWLGFNQCINEFITDTAPMFKTYKRPLSKEFGTRTLRPDWDIIDDKGNILYFYLNVNDPNEDTYTIISLMEDIAYKTGFFLDIDDKNPLRENDNIQRSFGQYLKKDHMFIPFQFDKEKVIQCWLRNNGQFPKDDEMFNPLRDAMEKVKLFVHSNRITV